MKSFIILYNGPPAPPDATHEGWPEWFQGLGEGLVDQGSPMANGFVVRPDGSTSDTPTGLVGFSIVRADDRNEVVELLGSHPLLAAGSPYTIEVFEVPMKG